MAVFQMHRLEFLLRKNSDSENLHRDEFSERIQTELSLPGIPEG
jgi:hypothetical protein